jgi:ligand-binding sensor domain-containing protein
MHHHSKFFFTIFFILLYGLLHAQPENTYQAHPIHLPDFLANRTIKSVFQDHIGLLWIGTKNGVYTYDGIKVQAFLQNEVSPISEEVINIVEDVYRNLWICTTKGPLILNQNRSNLAYRHQYQTTSILAYVK